MNDTGETERCLLAIVARDARSLALARRHLDPEMFRTPHRDFVRLLCEWFDAHGEPPPAEVVVARLGERTARHFGLPGSEEVTERLREWFRHEFAAWVRRRRFAVEVQRAAEALGSDRIDEHVRRIAEIAHVHVDDDPGLDPLDRPAELARRLREMRGCIATGWPEVDERLHGGVGRGELTIFAGLSGAGKSLCLQNLAVRWRAEGLTVVYVTLELSVELCGVRMAAMATGTPVSRIVRDPDSVEPVPAPGRILLRYMPGRSPIGHVAAYVRALRLVHGIQPDAVMVDYMDEVEPEGLPASRAIPTWERDRWVASQLRALAVAENVALVTATQLNRTAVGQPELDMDHIGGGLGKVQVADTVVAIRSDREMREKGIMELKFVKTRSSSGVGSTVRLSREDDTLRIGHRPVAQPLPEEDAKDANGGARRRGAVDAKGEVPDVFARLTGGDDALF